MATWIVLSVLAAFGALCVGWTLFGFLLPGQYGGALVCICRGNGEEEPLIRHYGWLRDLGMIRAPLLLIDCGLTQEERSRLRKGRQEIEFCTWEELPSRLEQERNKLGRTGI